MRWHDNSCGDAYCCLKAFSSKATLQVKNQFACTCTHWQNGKLQFVVHAILQIKTMRLALTPDTSTQDNFKTLLQINTFTQRRAVNKFHASISIQTDINRLSLDMSAVFWMSIFVLYKLFWKLWDDIVCKFQITGVCRVSAKCKKKT